MMSEIAKQINGLRPGDALEVNWYDAYNGEIRLDRESDNPAQFEVSVTSLGSYLAPHRPKVVFTCQW